MIHGDAEAVNARQFGTKAAAIYRLTIPAEAQAVVRLRLTAVDEATSEPFADFDDSFAARIREADAFYAERIPSAADDEAANVARQAYAGLLWSKQFYHYVVKDWLAGDADQPPPPASRHSVGITTGPTCSIATSSRCPTSGSIPGTPRGISRST